jgi:IrrE N-terminal-like domain
LGFARGFKAEANRIALRVREKMCLPPDAPIDPFEVCGFYDITVIGLSELDCDSRPFFSEHSSSFSAVTVPRGLHRAIVHNDSHHPYRQRSNICHELAHCFLGHDCTPPLTASGERVHDGGIEAEANFLGGTLLIPNDAARRIVMTGLSYQTAQREFGVSADMLEYRLRMSGAHVIARRVGKPKP